MRNIQSVNWRQLVEQLLNDPIFYDTMFPIGLCLHFPDNSEEWREYYSIYEKEITKYYVITLIRSKVFVNSTAKLNNAVIPIAGAPRTYKKYNLK